MTPPVIACPNAEEILRWNCGQLLNTPRHEEIEAHLARCPTCGVDLDIALGIVQWVGEEEAKNVPESALPVAYRHVADQVQKQRVEATTLLQGDPAAWSERLLTHPERQAVGFLWQLADAAIPCAVREPAAALALVKVLRPLVDGLPDTLQNRCFAGETMALLGLAEGVGHRTLGDHAAALESYAEGERYIPERALSNEYARINLARAASFRYLDRLDEAHGALVLARQAFARTGDGSGEAKAVWELGNLAYHRGELEHALSLAEQALEGFIALHDDESASVVKLAMLAYLVAIPRAPAARQLLAELHKDPNLRDNAYQQARLIWHEGRLAATEGALDEASGLLESAAAAMQAVGALVPGAAVLLDLAHVAGEMGDIPRRAAVASQAIAILATSSQRVDLLIAVKELQDAILTGAQVAELLTRLRRRLAAI